MPNSSNDDLARVLAYHHETKHHPQRYARSVGYMDWDTQPNPFRFYEGAPRVPLPLLSQDPSRLFSHCSRSHRAKGLERGPNAAELAGILELSLGLSAWKEAGGSRWALRMNPSSGNLHPTEAHVLLPYPLQEDLPAGIYHYQPLEHALERRILLTKAAQESLEVLFAQTPGVLLLLTSIAWREAWKYGERAFRYVNHDVGHALGALSYAAAALDVPVTGVRGLSHGEMCELFCLDALQWPEGEEEIPEGIVFLGAGELRLPTSQQFQGCIALLRSCARLGEPASLSSDHVDWQIISEVCRATERGEGAVAAEMPLPLPFDTGGVSVGVKHLLPEVPLAQLIRQRRSAVDFDGKTGMDAAALCAMLSNTRYDPEFPPFAAWPMAPVVNLVLFVHRVRGLPSGAYVFCREQEGGEAFRALCRSDFLWKQAVSDLPLFLLVEGDLQREAAYISCGQEIAGDSCFSLGMLARFSSELEREPARYRELFWECGMIGQALYLGAEAYGLRGTGIGCFHDDLMHSFLGLRGAEYQTLYHFTVGGAVEDSRLSTLPPYDGSKPRRLSRTELA